MIGMSDDHLAKPHSKEEEGVSTCNASVERTIQATDKDNFLKQLAIVPSILLRSPVASNKIVPT